MMTDEKDRPDPAPAPKKHPDLFAKLTERDWVDAMEYGRKVDEAKDERIRKAIKGEKEET
jgi:hypothetical protein